MVAPVSTSPLSRHIVWLQVDPQNTDVCSICTFTLLEASMYDDDDGDDSEAPRSRMWSKLAECGHVFHERCLEELMRTTPTHIQCPHCKRIYGLKMGNQPTNATMQHTIVSTKLAGYENVNTIQITYSVQGGVQGPEHPNPGRCLMNYLQVILIFSIALFHFFLEQAFSPERFSARGLSAEQRGGPKGASSSEEGLRAETHLHGRTIHHDR